MPDHRLLIDGGRDQGPPLLDRLLSEEPLDLSKPLDLIVIAAKERAARCRLPTSRRVVTLRATSLYRVVAGQIITVAPGRCWRHAGQPHLSGHIVDARIDAAALGLAPLALRAAGQWVPGRRPAFELDAPAIPADFDEENLHDPGVAEKLLEADLRFLEAHAHLARGLLEHSPRWAITHFEVGVQIGEFSVGESFAGVLPWRLPRNRPFLVCLAGYGSCLWRLGRHAEAARVLERVLRLDPADRQGVRAVLPAVRAGEPWRDAAQR